MKSSVTNVFRSTFRFKSNEINFTAGYICVVWTVKLLNCSETAYVNIEWYVYIDVSSGELPFVQKVILTTNVL